MLMSVLYFFRFYLQAEMESSFPIKPIFLSFFLEAYAVRTSERTALDISMINASCFKTGFVAARF
jgi:hypothetical protein